MIYRKDTPSFTADTFLKQVQNVRIPQAGTNGVLHQSELDPATLGAALPNMAIFERIAPGQARIRLAGQVFHKLTGLDPRGMPISALISPQGRSSLAEIIEDVFAKPATAFVQLRANRGFGRAPLRGQMALVPLRDDAELVRSCLGYLTVQGPVGRPPRRFEIDSHHLLTPGPVKPFDDDSRTQATHVPHLRLVVGD